jgi:hypothetical protein
LRKAAAFLDTKEIVESVRLAADSLRKLPAAKRHANVSYSLVVKAGYEEIRGLREDGYSFDLVCETLTKYGILPEYANPKALCTAFLREKKRREKRDAQKRDGTKKTVTPVTGLNLPVKPLTKAPEAAKTNLDNETAEKERIRKMTGVTVNTGLGTIVKHSDGTFDIV